MKFNQIICLDYSGQEFTKAEWQEIDHLTENIVFVQRQNLLSNTGLKHTDVLLVKLGAKVDKVIMDSLPKLKYIGVLGTGYGGVDTVYARERGIVVTNIADYATEGVAEFTLGILIETLRDIAKAKNQAAKGDYSDDFSGSEIRGKKFGVVGLGNIGKRTALLAYAFGAEVQYWSKHRKPEVEALGIKYCPLNKLLASSDVIALNLALNPQTCGIISTERLKTIKKGAILINPSPMELIDFKSLLRRLKKGDVQFLLDHSDEMTADQLKSLHQIPNCIIYPPIAYLTTEASLLKKRIFVANLRNFLAKKPTNQVN